MSLLVVGSLAFDSVETPYGKVENVLGGSAVFFSYAASFFTEVRVVGVVGKDFPDAFRDILRERPIDISGVKEVDGKTFRWSGAYEGDMNQAETRHVELNVLGEFEPEVPEQFADSDFVFLANASPSVQMRVLESVKFPKFAVADTMNYWIENDRDDLLELLKRVDGLVLNDGEARMLTGVANLIAAAKKISAMGPRYVIVKKGEHGSLLVSEHGVFVLPAYPLEEVKDPTGAGDSFAGGMMGYLASVGYVSQMELKRAIAYGTICASFDVEDFSLNRLRQIDREDIDQRYREFLSAIRVE